MIPEFSNQRARFVLVRVVKLDMQETHRESATLLVLKSWKGTFSAGHVLHTPEFIVCGSRLEDCGLYYFQLGDRSKGFLIMSRGFISGPDGTNPAVERDAVWPAAKSPALMAALDQGVGDSMPTDKR